MGCEDSEVQTFSVELGEGGTLRGSSILISESGLPVSSKLFLSVSASLKQGIPLSNRGLNGALVGSRQTLS